MLREIRHLPVRMARENPTWGCRRIQGALRNLGHRVARSTVATILRANGIDLVPQRLMSWGTFLAANRGAIADADFFTTEVWTMRVHLVGSTPYPDDAFVRQVARVVSGADDDVLRGYRILICDRDAKWSAAFGRTLADVGIRVVQTRFQAPNRNAHAERFVQWIKEECVNRVVSLGEAHWRRTLTAFTAHYDRERNHQGPDAVG